MFDVMGFMAANAIDESLLVPETESEETKKEEPVKRTYMKFTPEETEDLWRGCNRHGVGNWKAILLDEDYRFNNRSTVDLKDHFRVRFKDEYKRHYPSARGKQAKPQRAAPNSIEKKAQRRMRVPFSPQEDEYLRRGYCKHGCSWSRILKDPEFTFASSRQYRDLRDRFRIIQPVEFASRPKYSRHVPEVFDFDTGLDSPTYDNLLTYGNLFNTDTLVEPLNKIHQQEIERIIWDPIYNQSDIANED